jgi:Cu/Ag efflux protein CusF
MMNKLIATATATLALAAGTVPSVAAASAHDAHGRGATQDAPALAQAAAAPTTEGVVRKVDKDNRKITLKHGEITNLGMPPMTMVFRVDDAALLDRVQPGAKVRFRAEQDGGSFKVTAIEPAK